MYIGSGGLEASHITSIASNITSAELGGRGGKLHHLRQGQRALVASHINSVEFEGGWRQVILLFLGARGGWGQVTLPTLGLGRLGSRDLWQG